MIFDRTVARYVRERRWHPTQRFRTLSDGRLELTMRVADTLEVRQWIQGFGAAAEVLEPASLREAILEEATRLIQSTEDVPPRRPLTTDTSDQRSQAQLGAAVAVGRAEPQLDFAFIGSLELCRALRTYWEEAQAAASNGLFTSSVVLCGSVVEGMLIDALTRDEKESRRQCLSLIDQNRITDPGFRNVRDVEALRLVSY